MWVWPKSERFMSSVCFHHKWFKCHISLPLTLPVKSDWLMQNHIWQVLLLKSMFYYSMQESSHDSLLMNRFVMAHMRPMDGMAESISCICSITNYIMLFIGGFYKIALIQIDICKDTSKLIKRTPFPAFKHMLLLDCEPNHLDFC